ncbi:MAG TPA: hypothetical protein VGF32_29925, partial [Streptosporangiaceae bacterium]
MTSTDTLPAPDPSLPTDTHVPRVEIVVPVRNEERDLGPSVRRLVAYLRGGPPSRPGPPPLTALGLRASVT